jgi:hypothetical protein
VFGPGLGAAFVSSQIAALTGVAEEESGLVDTSFNIGSALGVAIAASAVVSAAGARAAAAQVDPLSALTDGLGTAFLITAVFAGVGLITALFVPRRSPAPIDD